MAIADINISETLEAGAPSIKYEGDMRTSNTQVASHQGNDAWLENRIEALMDMGLDWASAAQQAQKELREGEQKQLDLIQKEKVELDIQMEEPLKNTLKSLED